MPPAEVLDIAAQLAPLVGALLLFIVSLVLFVFAFIGWAISAAHVAVQMFGWGRGLAWLGLVVMLSVRLAYSINN